jgi:hypothetical protein
MKTINAETYLKMVLRKERGIKNNSNHGQELISDVWFPTGKGAREFLDVVKKKYKGTSTFSLFQVNKEEDWHAITYNNNSQKLVIPPVPKSPEIVQVKRDNNSQKLVIPPVPTKAGQSDHIQPV